MAVTVARAGILQCREPCQGAWKPSTPPVDLRIQYPPVAGSTASPTARTPARSWPAFEPYHEAPRLLTVSAESRTWVPDPTPAPRTLSTRRAPAALGMRRRATRPDNTDSPAWPK